MKLYPLLAVLLLAHDARPASTGGTVTGTVTVRENGQPPKTKRDDVFVYLEQVSPRRKRPRASTLPLREIRQEKEQFVPHVLVVPAGTTVAFPNYDHEEHNVFSPSDVAEFDLGRYNTDHKGKTKEFPDPGEVAIYCDIHQQMWARIKVVDADVITKVDADGKFKLDNVPPGKYVLHVWTYASEEFTQPLPEITDGANVVANDAHLQLGKVETHLRKDGTKYGIYSGH